MTRLRRRAVPAVAALAAVGALLGGCAAQPPAEPAPTRTADAPSPTGGSASAAPVPSGELVTSTLRVPDGLGGGPLDREREVRAPEGWTVSVWARLPLARLAVWTPDDRMLVSVPKSGAVVVLTPGDGGAPEQRTLLDGLEQPHGLAFRGDTLYVAQSDRITAYDYADGAVSGERLVLGGLPDAKSPELRGAYSHALKSVAVAEDGTVYVAVGSTGNTSVEDRDADPERASVLVVEPGSTEARTFARGVRNGTGLALDPDGGLWTAVNGRDNTAYPFAEDYDGDGRTDAGQVLADYVADHPVEQLALLTDGRELGWPFCNSDPDVEPGVNGTEFDYDDMPFVRDVELNADGSAMDCSALPAVEQGMPAHSAPLGLAFATGLPAPFDAGALVGVHGSWNRTPPRAPEVTFFPWRDGALGERQTFLGGFQYDDGSRWGRPVAAVQGPDGAVYVTDDYAGAIYRMVRG